MLTFQVEKWADALPELRDLFPLLWDEVALDKDRLTSNCDERCLPPTVEKLNMLHVVTARDDRGATGRLSCVSFITPHMHYKGAGPMAFTDMYFVREPYRAGVGTKLLMFLEQSLRARGVIKAYLSHKVAHHSEVGCFRPSAGSHPMLLYIARCSHE